MKIWVDADACPVVIKEILFRAAERTGIETTLVANQPLTVPRSRFIKTLQVPAGFDVADNEIVTPDLSGAGVAGIMRRKVLEIAHQHELPVNVRPFHRDSLNAVEEVFLTNSQFGLLPVSNLDGRALAVGRQTRSISARLVDAGIEETAC